MGCHIVHFVHTVYNEAAPASISAVRYRLPDKWELRALDFFDDKSLVLLIEVKISAKACELGRFPEKDVCLWRFHCSSSFLVDDYA